MNTSISCDGMQAKEVDDHKARENTLFQAANTASLDLYSIQAVARMLSDHPSVGKSDFPDDVAGGIHALVALAEAAAARLQADL